MSDVGAGMQGCDATFERGSAAAKGAADFLYLAAAPTFAIMALVTGLLGEGADALCSMSGASPLGGASCTTSPFIAKLLSITGPARARPASRAARIRAR